MKNCPIGLLTATVALVVPTDAAHGAVSLYTSSADWQAAVPSFTTIGFADLPSGTFLTNQYAPFGVTFAQGDDNVTSFDFNIFPTDGAGLDGNLSILLEFAAPMNWLAMDYPGGMKIKLFSQGQTIYTSPIFPPGSGVGNFAGIISSQSFDSALLYDWLPNDQVFIDNLYFGAPIPIPASLSILSLGGLLAGSRKRSSG